MEASASAPRALKINRADKEKEKDNGSSSGKEKTNVGGDEKGVKTPRTTRYKDKFTALRDRYERVVALQHTYHRDLDTANAKMKKMQEEIDLLLEALMPTTPPPSVFERSTEREMYYGRAHGMDVDSDPQRDQASMSIHHLNQPMHHDNSRSRHPQTNGKTNGNTSNRPRRYSMEPEQELNPNYLPREGSSRIPIS